MNCWIFVVFHIIIVESHCWLTIYCITDWFWLLSKMSKPIKTKTETTSACGDTFIRIGCTKADGNCMVLFLIFIFMFLWFKIHRNRSTHTHRDPRGLYNAVHPTVWGEREGWRKRKHILWFAFITCTIYTPFNEFNEFLCTIGAKPLGVCNNNNFISVYDV